MKNESVLKHNQLYFRAADWNLSEPEWTGRMKLVSKGNDCTIKLEDKNSGELFAKCPIEQYPGIAIESVADSSRYFVLRLQDDNGVFCKYHFDDKVEIFEIFFLGRSAFIGIGFTDRSDSFDLNVALQDHFKRLQTDQAIEKEKEEPKQQLDLSFKEGETIKINMKITVSINKMMIFLIIKNYFIRKKMAMSQQVDPNQKVALEALESCPLHQGV